MADGEDGQRDPPTVPEQLPDRTRPLSVPPPELPRSATKFVVTVMVIGAVLVFAILVVIATSMGGSDGQRGNAEPVASEPAASEPAASEPAVSPSQSVEPPVVPEPAEPADSGGTDDGFDLEDITHVTVPDVVGVDLQTAQEELFPRLRTTSVDATGEDRRQLVDSNWIVVRMDPPAGEQVPRLTDVTLYVVKEGETPQS